MSDEIRILQVNHNGWALITGCFEDYAYRVWAKDFRVMRTEALNYAIIAYYGIVADCPIIQYKTRDEANDALLRLGSKIDNWEKGE